MLAGVLFYFLAVQRLLAQDTDGAFSDSAYRLSPGGQIKVNIDVKVKPGDIIQVDERLF